MQSLQLRSRMQDITNTKILGEQQFPIHLTFFKEYIYLE